mgnify:CR=1 FL=1
MLKRSMLFSASLCLAAVAAFSKPGPPRERPLGRVVIVSLIIAALGAALLAGVGAGAWPDVDAACEGCISLTGSTAPDVETAAQYEPRYAQYRALYPALKEISHNLSEMG